MQHLDKHQEYHILNLLGDIFHIHNIGFNLFYFEKDYHDARYNNEDVSRRFDPDFFFNLDYPVIHKWDDKNDKLTIIITHFQNVYGIRCTVFTIDIRHSSTSIKHHDCIIFEILKNKYGIDWENI